LIVNEHELIALCDRLGISHEGALLAEYAKCQLIITCGSVGILDHDPTVAGNPEVLPAPEIKVVDTTGAGDTFIGIFCRWT
jgi:ribokinase